jgi:hypothetical protein
MFIRFNTYSLTLALFMLLTLSCSNSNQVKPSNKPSPVKKVTKVEAASAPSQNALSTPSALQASPVQGMRLPNMMEMPQSADLQASNPNTPSPATSSTGSVILATPNSSNPEVPNQPNQ